MLQKVHDGSSGGGGGDGEERKSTTRHMWTCVPTRPANLIPADASSSSFVSQPNSFFKDGRKISVGDCALFKPPQDSPPFIGIIRCLTTSKEDKLKLKLGVNWLYRPAEVKLGKGVLLEAAPNEIFYSFHKDEIPAASLLHPCKVAFLPKGVELPSGISSFVCREVYDITNKCLWWLTDQDYINERQEEVDQLLENTRIEMHATLQPGGRSPKPMSGPTSTSQLKAGSDSVQNSASSIPSQVKGKKRERGDQSTEPVKRERTTKTDDVDSGHSRLDSNLKSETAKITEKGGLIDSEGVERLLQLMLLDRNEKKVDLAGRSMLAGVIAATEKMDWLNRFVQLRGLPVFDEWLQEVHKGKIGDASGLKDGDKSVEDFLLVLLRALDKLPVNLQALQMCNIGKSVNHLRTHKNLEIQKKARSLVDTWKKRVEAEMNINDAKSGSNQGVTWTARSRLPEVSPGGNRQSGVSSDVAVKSPAQLSASKTAPVKVVQGESTSRSASASPGSMKTVPSTAPASTNLKDGQGRNAVGFTSDPPQATVKDEKSSSSSQSHNSQSCSSDHTKTGLSGKEDARSPTAGSMSGNKTSGGSSRHRKSINGLPGSALSGVQRESCSSRSSTQKHLASEKQLQSGLPCEKALDGPVNEGNGHKLIVKIPNRVRSPAQSASGASFEDPSLLHSRASSPVLSEKHDQFDRSLKEKSDAYRANITSDLKTESWQSNDFKDVLTGSDEGDGSPPAITDEERCRSGDDSKKWAEAKAASTSSGNEHKLGNSEEGSLRSINALIESCVKYSEANASISIGDDGGMNLLASVAAGEMSKSDVVSPADSPQRNTLAVEHSCSGSDSKVKSSPADDLARNRSQCNDGADVEHEKQGLISSNVGPKNGEGNSASLMSEEKVVEGHSGSFHSSSKDLQQTADPCKESNGKSTEMTVPASVASPAITVEKTMDIEGGKHLEEKKAVDGVNADAIPDAKEKVSDSLSDRDKVDVSARLEVHNEVIEGSSSHPSLEIDGDDKKFVNEGLNSGVKTEQKPPALMIHSESVKGTNEEVLRPSGGGKDLVPGNVNELKTEKTKETDVRSNVNLTEIRSNMQEGNALTIPENQIVGSGLAITDREGEYLDEKLESKEGFVQRGRPVPHKVFRALPVQETECEQSRGSKLTGMEVEDTEECTSTTADAASMSAVGASDMEARMEFDLNEGFASDDGKLGEASNLTATECSTALRLVSPLPFPISSVTSGLPASITVAAAAKGPFVPPDDLLKSKGELGWKGSAATSAFRPAEPRKAPEMAHGTANIPLPDATVGKQSRPPLDIDLNFPDERILEDLACRDSAPEPGTLSGPINNPEMAREELMGTAPVRFSGLLDLDLNRVDDASDMGNYLTSNSCRTDVPLVPVKSSSSPLNDAVSVRRDFDLNDGPVVDEMSAEPSPFSLLGRSSQPSQPPVSGLRMNNTEMGNFSPWFATGSTYSGVIPSIIPDRGEQPFPIVAPGGPQRLLGPTGGSNPFSPDVYRGPVLSSSPAVPFPSSPFQYPVFPFGTTFPLSSAAFSGGSTTYMDSSSGGKVCFPAVHTQFLGPAGAVPSHYPRPYVVSFPDGSNNSSAESSRKWGRQGLDLNAGPGVLDVEGRDETSSLPPRQLSVASSQAIADEQARIYQVGGVLKRKEPEGGWDSYKQSWQ